MYPSIRFLGRCRYTRHKGNAASPFTDLATNRDAPDLHEHRQDDFDNKSLKARKPIVWVPDDLNGVSAEELGAIRSKVNGVKATSEKATVSVTGKINTSGIPSCMDSQDLNP